MTLADIYRWAGVSDILSLFKFYDREDQRLMKGGEWDYENISLAINRIKSGLEQVDPETITLEEREWRREILWFWYHHAVSCAIRKKDRASAKRYAAKAILLQGGDHPNRITRLLYLLVCDRLDDAIAWAEAIDDEVEGPTAASLVESYQKGEFF